MLSTIIVVLVVVAVGARVGDGLRVKQEEIILGRLPESEAVTYYEVLRKRVNRVRLLRAVTLVSLLVMIFVGRRRLFPPETFADAVKRRTDTTDQARRHAEVEIEKYAARERIDAGLLQLDKVGGDDRHPWVFDFKTRGEPRHHVRVFVGRDGKVETHRIMQ